MKLSVTSLLLLCLTLAGIPAMADTLYSNGPVNGTTDAWTINFGYVVSDTFIAPQDATMSGFDFYAWLIPGDTVTSVDWAVTSAEFGGTVYGSGTAAVTGGACSSNQYGYNVCLESVTNLTVNLTTGLYWLNLQNAIVPSGDPVYWDENSGPSSASESAVGTIPSEAFDVIANGHTCGTDCGPPSPEPGSIVLVGSGILALAGVLRRRLF